MKKKKKKKKKKKEEEEPHDKNKKIHQIQSHGSFNLGIGATWACCFSLLDLWVGFDFISGFVSSFPLLDFWVRFDFVSQFVSSVYASSMFQYMKLESLRLELLQWTWVQESRDVSFLNSLIITNEIVSSLLLNCKTIRFKTSNWWWLWNMNIVKGLFLT